MDTPKPEGRPIYGMLTDPCRDIIREISSARRMGFDFVELGIEIPEGHPEILERRRAGILRALGLFRHPPVGHTPYWSDLWSDYEGVRQAWLDVARESVNAAACLGCRKMNIHAPVFSGMYQHSARHNRHAVMNFMKSMKEIVDYASRMNVKVMLENMGPFGMTFDQYEYVIKRTAGLGAHIDTGHAFLEGGMRMVSRHIMKFRDKLEHIHFSDNMGLEDEHRGIGSGAIDYFRVMKLLKRIGYCNTITFEVFSGRKDLKDSLMTVRAMEEEIWPA